MRYDDRVVDQVQAANDIVEVISQYLVLKKSGRNLKACCPFHQEKSPSFMVNPEKQIFHCFGCSAGGDVFTFVMRYENMSFPEALRNLAEKAHIVLPEETQRNKGEGPSESEQIYEICRLATEFYHHEFLTSPKAKEARDYFLNRKYTLEIAKEFKMGWASDDWHALFDHLSKKGYKEAILLKSGLINRSPKGNLYDSFRSRILFPIQNLQGKNVGFGGRILGKSDGPKYLNSPETPVFSKRRELFGLNLAKKFINREKPQMIIVEGYFDFLRLFQKGFKYTAATLGTALTEDHVQLLKRFAEEAIVIYDGDKAGEAASLRGLEVFLEGGMNVRLVRMPAGFDPDDYLDKEEEAAFQKLIDDAKDFFDYKLDIMLGRYEVKDSLGLMRVTSEFLETLIKVKNPVLLDRYLRKLAGSLGVDETSLRNELLKLKKKVDDREKNFKGQSTSNQTHKPVVAQNKKSLEGQEEMMMLALAAEDATMRGEVFQNFQASDFQDPASARILELLSEKNQAGKPFNWMQVLNRLEDGAMKQKLTEVFSREWSADEKEKAFHDCLKKMKRKQLEKKLEGLRRSIAKAERSGDQTQIRVLAQEYQTLLKQSPTLG